MYKPGEIIDLASGGVLFRGSLTKVSDEKTPRKGNESKSQSAAKKESLSV